MKLTPPLPRIFLARHCMSSWNILGKLQGKIDIPLSEEGKKQARGILPLLEPLEIDRTYTSPARRAIETARIYVDHLKIPLDTHEGLRELDHGDWEGLSLEELMDPDRHSFSRWRQDPSLLEIPGQGESIHEARQRVVNALRQIASRHPGEGLLVVTHLHIRALLLCALADRPLRDFQSCSERSVEPMPVPEEQVRRLVSGKTP